MAGGWSSITDAHGRFTGTGHVENMGDAHEALRQCYGMVWKLASDLAQCTGPGTPGRGEALAVIADAARNHEGGAAIGGTRSRAEEPYDPEIEEASPVAPRGEPGGGQSAREYIESMYEYVGHVVQGYWCTRCWVLVRTGRRTDHWRRVHGFTGGT